MYSVGHKPDRTEGESELIGSLSLVGLRGSFVGILNQRQLTIENLIGQGLRIDLASISKMRHMDIPILPSGTPVLGIMGIIIGYFVLIPPLGWIISSAGLILALSHLRLRRSVLVIEDNSGSRHMVGGREGSLMRLCLITDRLRRGESIDEARKGLEKIEDEMPIFPAFQDAGGMPSLKALPWPPSPPEAEIISIPITIDKVEEISIPEISEISNPLDFGFAGFSSEAEASFVDFDRSTNLHSMEAPSSQDNENSISAYERAWGREEAPSWYREKETRHDSGSRLESVLPETTDMFGFGSIFDDDSPPTSEITSPPQMFENSFVDSNMHREPPRPPSSSQMIRRAHTQRGVPTSGYSGTLLPEPTVDAVREECVPGIVRQARARQADSRKVLRGANSELADLNEYPGVSKMVASMNDGRLSKEMIVRGRKKPSWIESLLRPRSRAGIGKEESYASQYGDTDGGFSHGNSRFQTSQHIRLRSDQDHQADLVSRTIPMEPDSHLSAKDVLDSLVESVSSGRTRGQKQLSLPSGGLKFSQLKKAPTKGEKHHIPGVRRLE